VFIKILIYEIQIIYSVLLPRGLFPEDAQETRIEDMKVFLESR
jgi:hypothetical protein